MDQYIELASVDQHVFRAFVAEPPMPAQAALVVLQEMDQRGWDSDSARAPAVHGKASLPGVNAYARAVAKRYAAAGYLAIVPSTFSRGRSGRDYGYLYEDTQRKSHPRIIKPLQALDSPLVMLDIQAAIGHGRLNVSSGRVGMLGFCWGGLLAWRVACSMQDVRATVCYYGGGMTDAGDLAQKARCPVLVHMGQDNQWMTQASIEAFRSAHSQPAHNQPTSPEVQVLGYDADYGFDHPHRRAFNKSAALLASQRTHQFLAQHLLADLD
jgi:carboxymethylenebutenolidase